jgi:hypothetical protein
VNQIKKQYEHILLRTKKEVQVNRCSNIYYQKILDFQKEKLRISQDEYNKKVELLKQSNLTQQKMTRVK